MMMPLPKFFRSRHVSLATACLLVLAAPACRNRQAPPDRFQADAAIQKATALLEADHYERALKALEPALQFRPNDPVVINIQGAILTKLKDYPGAMACYERALKISPGFFAARYNIGIVLALQEQWDQAINYFRNLLIEAPNNELVEYKLLLLLLHENADPELECKLFPSGVPSNTPAWYYAIAARRYKAGQRGEAEKYLAVALSVFGEKTAIFQQELDQSGLNKARP
jgi:tetratricopeptide (TPR) repeat protein